MAKFVFFLTLFYLSKGFSDGFYLISITPNKSRTIDNISSSSSIVSFYQSDPYSLKVQCFDLSDNFTFKFTTKGTFIFHCKKIIFTAFQKEQKVYMWQIPNNYCNYSLILHAENQLDATTITEHHHFPICIFTQFNGIHFFLSLSMPTDSKSILSFYSKDLSKPQICQNKIICDYFSSQPFFVQIKKPVDLKENRDLKMSLNYKVTLSSAQKDNMCQVLPLPTVTKNSFFLLPTFSGDSAVVCTNIAQGNMNTIISLIITILLTITVLFLIHCIGAINILRVCKLDDQVADFSGYRKAGIRDDPGPLLD